MKCGKSHDIDLILDEEEKLRLKRKKKDDSEATASEQPTRLNGDSGSPTSPTIIESTNHTKSTQRNSMPPDIAHTAHIDSYMTGVVLARQLHVHSRENVMDDHSNKLYLIGKERPLLIEKSQYSSTSMAHQVKKTFRSAQSND